MALPGRKANPVTEAETAHSEQLAATPPATTEEAPASVPALPETPSELAFEDVDAPEHVRSVTSVNPYNAKVQELMADRFPEDSPKAGQSRKAVKIRVTNDKIAKVERALSDAGKDNGVSIRRPKVADGNGWVVTFWVVPQITRKRETAKEAATAAPDASPEAPKDGTPAALASVPTDAPSVS